MTQTQTNYVIFGQLKLKDQRDIVGARMHNMREKHLGNVEAHRPPPVVVYGEADIWAGVLARLKELRIKPRDGAVLAMELMFATSPEWWVKDEAAQALQRIAFERQTMKYLRARFSPEAIISMVWHLDESSPHLHVVVIPVRQRVDARFSDGAMRWTLCARGELLPKFEKGADRQAAYAAGWRGGMGGRGHMAYEQTRVAEVMAPLGLKRGKLWSGAPNKTNGQHHAEMAVAIATAEDRTAKADAREMAAIMAEADALGERDRYRALSAEVDAKASALDDRATELAAREAEVARQVAALADREAALAADRAALDERSERAALWTKAAKKKEARLAAENDRLKAEGESVRVAGAANVAEVMQIERIAHLLIGLVVSPDPNAREAARLVEQLRNHVDARARDDMAYGRTLRVARASRLAGAGLAA